MKLERALWSLLFCVVSAENCDRGTLCEGDENEQKECKAQYEERIQDCDESTGRFDQTAAKVGPMTSRNGLDFANPCVQRTDDGTWTAFPSNDDGSTAAIGLGFTFKLYGDSYVEVYVNNNGNLSFDGPYSTYTSSGFPSSSFAMVAPFWADVDTRNEKGLTYYKTLGSNSFVATWDDVGYYYAFDDSNQDFRNTFQVVISDGTNQDMGLGNNVCFCYADMQWTTGDASDGVDGFGGTPATVGVNRGNNDHYFQLGRFDQSGDAFDGQYGANDGVEYLQGIGSFCFNTVEQNIPPVSGLPSTIEIRSCEGTGTETFAFESPEQDQSTTVTYVDHDGVVAAGLLITITPGPTAFVQLHWDENSNIPNGVYSVTFTATDNYNPAGVTTQMVSIEVTACNDDLIVKDPCTILLTGSEGIEIGTVCTEVDGDYVEVCINITAGMDESASCCLKETHICNAPNEMLFDISFDNETDCCEQEKKYIFSMYDMHNFMCEEECQMFQLDGHATILCDEPLLADDFDSGGDKGDQFGPPIGDVGRVNVDYYEGNWDTLPDFSSLVPYTSDIVPNINYPHNGDMAQLFATSGRSDTLGAVFEGEARFPKTGDWMLCVDSDDGSKVYVDDTLLINNDGLKNGMFEVCANITIVSPGPKHIKVEYFEKTGLAGLVLSWKGPDTPKAQIPPSAWYPEGEYCYGAMYWVGFSCGSACS